VHSCFIPSTTKKYWYKKENVVTKNFVTISEKLFPETERPDLFQLSLVPKQKLKIKSIIPHPSPGVKDYRVNH
jgi:hypothetical protein